MKKRVHVGRNEVLSTVFVSIRWGNLKCGAFRCVFVGGATVVKINYARDVYCSIT